MQLLQGAGQAAASGGAASSLGASVGNAISSAAGSISPTLQSAIGSFGGELGEGGMGPMTGASGFLGGLGQATGGMGVANPSLGSMLGTATGIGMQMRGGNRLGGLQSAAQMTGILGPATKQSSVGIGPQQQHKGLLSGLLSG